MSPVPSTTVNRPRWRAWGGAAALGATLVIMGIGQALAQAQHRLEVGSLQLTLGRKQVVQRAQGLCAHTLSHHVLLEAQTGCDALLHARQCRDTDMLLAVEDAGRYRDGVGSSPPDGIPEAFLAPVSGALEGLLTGDTDGRLSALTSLRASIAGLRPTG